jgi:tetratricopeptide (TPR) repeat protein
MPGKITRRLLAAGAIFLAGSQCKKERSLEDMREQCAALARNRKPQEAEQCYTNVLRLKPDNAEALHERGTLLFSQGKYPEAARDFGEAFKLRSFPMYLNSKCDALDKQGNREEGEKCRVEYRRLAGLGKPATGADAGVAVELEPALYSALGLPLPEKGKKLDAAYNDLTKAVDGNTDKKRDGWVEPHELYEEVFGHREKYESVIAKLRDAGLEDPFEITAEIGRHVDKVLNRYHSETQLQKAILLFRSILPSSESFELKGERYSGLKEREGGLEIPFSKEKKVPLRIQFGDLLPKEIIGAAKNERVAYCLEYSHLLIAFLRSAGIEAWTKGEPDHAYVLAVLDGGKYRLDVAKTIFGVSTEVANADRESIAAHYLNEGSELAAQGKPEEALRCYDQAVRIKPDYASIWVNKGTVYEDQGKDEEALRCYDQALQIRPDDPYAKHNKGNIYLKQGKTAEALSYFEQAVKIKPDFAEAWHNKGFALNRLGKTEEALRSYDQALKIQPDHVEAWNNKANALDKLGRKTEALRCYDQVLRLKSDHAEAWSNKGNTLVDLGKYEEAQRCFERSLQIRPNDEITWFNKGVALRQEGKMAEALRCYDQALKIKPDYAAAWNNKGIVFYKQDKLAEALRCFDQALKIEPDQAEAWNNKAAVLTDQGKLTEALHCLDQALKAAPKDANTWDNKATLLNRLGRREEAQKCSDKSRSLSGRL